MTLCIAVVCKMEAVPTIVTVSDFKLSSKWSSMESRVPKMSNATPDEPYLWQMLFSGSSTYALFIRSWALTILNGQERASRERLGVVTGAYQDAFQFLLRKICADKVLTRYNMDLDAFKKHGLKQFGGNQFEKMCKQIEKIELETDILLCGFSVGGGGSIVAIKDPGVIETYEHEGYAAIGAGSYLAEQVLDATFDPHAPKEEIIYRLCEAKFWGEAAEGVGDSTLITIHNSQGFSSRISTEDAEKIRAEWQKTAHSLSPNVLALIKNVNPIPTDFPEQKTKKITSF